jgi:hypothetical protein
MKTLIIAATLLFMTGVQAIAGGGHGGYGGHGGCGYYGGGHHGSFTSVSIGLGGWGYYGGYYPWYWGSGYGYYGGGYCAPPVVYAPAPVYYAAPAVMERPVVVEKTVVVNNYYYGSGNDHWKPKFSDPAR